jgi:glycosyl transferase, family 25
LLKSYDQIWIINLSTRSDRRREMMQELDRLGLVRDPRVKFFNAIVPADAGNWNSLGEHGCFMSHLSILKEANAAGASVLILEDDCDFTDAALTSSWGVGTSIFYGGFGASDYTQLETGNIQGAHCMGFDRAVLPRLVSFLLELAAGPSPSPIDGAYVEFRRANPDLRTEFALPQVAIQRRSPSDISPGRFDRNKWSSLAVGVLRRLNRNRHRRAKMMDGL